ncbi:hypothetical protein PInf_030278 [Phytophthora infestans]|nr:hypothetical protein PInf_030278 [Phytophthora infestans]
MAAVTRSWLDPKSLATDWTYVKPGAPAKGAIGIDVFVGEAAVVAHIIEAGLLGVDNDDEAIVYQEGHKTEEKDDEHPAIYGGQDIGNVTETCKFANTPAMKRGEWYAVLHKQLLQLKELDFADSVATPSPGSKKRRRKRHDHSLI